MESRKLISATDTLYSGTLLASLNEQRIHGLYCDVTVIIGDKKFRAHKNILSASSTYFHQLFSVVDQVVELTFVRAEIFAEILNYIYSSKILRVRSDLLEELIKSGKFLGVKFLADLEVPLSHMKNMAGGVKDNSAEDSPLSLDQKVVIVHKTVTEQPAISKYMNEDGMITATATENIIFPREEINELKKAPDPEEEGEDSDNDVIFCSQLEPPKPIVLSKLESPQQRMNPEVVTLDNSQMSDSNNTSAQTLHISQVFSTNNLPIKTVLPSQTNSLCINMPSRNQTLVSGTTFAFSQNHQLPTTMFLSPQLFNSPTIVSFPPRHIAPRIKLVVPQLPSVNTILKQPVIIANSSLFSSQNLLTNSLSDQPITNTKASFLGPKIHNFQKATLNEQATSKTSVLKIKEENVETEINNCAWADGAGSESIMDGENVLTLDTPSKIEDLLTSSTINTNVDENTCEMVIPIKEDSDSEDDDGAVELPRSVDGSPDCKRVKVKHEDHYELLIDGKVYYVCIVCKRSYMQIGSLKRHYNCHSWLKKYPCHFCERVFALAEYRTKHERRHTGEKRYQCMTCGEHFMHHRLMTNHVKSVHNLDAVADPKLYHLHSKKEWQSKLNLADCTAPTSPVPPVVKEEIVFNVDNIKEEAVSEGIDCRSPSKNVIWEEIFPPHGEEVVIMQSPNHCSTEFEFVIPESY